MFHIKPSLLFILYYLGPKARKLMRTINLIVIHCSATRCDRPFPMEALEACHRARGFRCCGYHYYITRDGQLHVGRSEDVPGAHARRYNAHSIGVCYEGGLDSKGEAADTRTPAQRHALIALLRSLKQDYPDAEILGHNDLPWVRKKCPCFDARAEYAEL